MILLGDIGGFTGIIIGLPSYFMSWYSSKMFKAQIYRKLPIKGIRKKKKKQKN